MREIIEQVEAWSQAGEPVAVATVIGTWGSAPRAVGAKMALTPAHHIAGSVSGGCVEGAVFEVGVETLAQKMPHLLHFGVADATALEMVGLACGGSIDVFVEPLTPALLSCWHEAFVTDTPVATATLVRGPAGYVGYKVMVGGDGAVRTSSQDERYNPITLQLLTSAQIALREGNSKRLVLPVTLPAPVAMGGGGEPAGAEEEMEAFIDVILPKPTLIIVGAVHIAIALTTIAKALGYHVVIIDPRAAFGNRDRFPHADQLIPEWPLKAFAALAITRTTAIVTLTHDAKFDDPALQIALASPAFYVGALGGTKTRAARRERLLKAGLTDSQINILHAPIGLDIGTRTPEEIALATMAQIVAARNARAKPCA